MHFEPLTREMKKIFEDFLSPYPYLASTYSFTNLYIWRKSQNIKISHTDNALYILKEKNGTPYFIPPVIKDMREGTAVYEALFKIMDDMGIEKVLKDADKSHVEEIQALGYEIEYASDRDQAEYIYTVEKMQTFSGKALHSKRNHFNNFIRYNDYTIKHIQESKEQCIDLAEKWYAASEKTPALTHEFEGIKELLSDPLYFGLVGISVFVDGVCQGFTLLEILNEDVILNHIEKADRSISGLYAFIARKAMEEFGEGIKYTNREQDMGIPGLRKSKESYVPEFLEEKFTVKFL